MSTKWHTVLARPMVATALLLAACTADRLPTTVEPALPPGLEGLAFHLTIDVRTGSITVQRPAPSLPDGVSASLIGNEAVELLATDCTWSPSPVNSKLRRCTFGLAIKNQLAITDLITPTSFPRPPAGTDGILVFPFASAALGVSGGAATPTSDWDNEPMNFFNDFSGCTGKSNDCYRSETYPSPLHGGEVTEYRTVGFDVDRNAHSVSVYVVVAADLRDNPLLEAVLIGSLAQCGNVQEITYLNDDSREVEVTLDIRTGQVENLTRRLVETAFCGFDMPALAMHGRILQATLRLYHDDDAGNPYAQSHVVVDHMDFGATLDLDDLVLDPLAENIGTLSTNATEEYKSLDVTAAVQDDATNGRPRSQYRIRFAEPVSDAWVAFGYAGSSRPPQLILTYRQY
jgi:hypothetical protein